MKRTTQSLKSIIAVIICIFALSLMTIHSSYAATVSFDVEVPSKSAAIGDKVEITVSIKADTKSLSKYSYTINYDSTLLEPVSGGTVEEEGSVSYANTVKGADDQMTATFVFTTLASGTASIETVATDFQTKSGTSIEVSSSYNSINISNKVATTAASTEASENVSSQDSATAESTLSQDLANEPSTVGVESETISDENTEDENLLTTPENTIVSVHSSGRTYNIIPKPSSVDAPVSYLPVKIKLNDTDVKAYVQRDNDSTVLLYAANTDGHQGWYFFNTEEGTFLDADEIIDQPDSLSGFMSKHKFVIMLIAIIVLVVLVVVIVILAISFKGLIADYEAQIEKLKKGTDESLFASGRKSNSKDESEEAVKIIHQGDEDIPTINNKALFPGDEEILETYADSDYDNQVSMTDIHDHDTDTHQQPSMDDIDAVLESAKKYKNK